MQWIADKLVTRGAVDFEPGDVMRGRGGLDVKANDALAVGVDLETVLRVGISLRVHAANRMRQRPDSDGRVNVRRNGVATRCGDPHRRPARLNVALVWHGNSSVLPKLPSRKSRIDFSGSC